MGSKNIKDLLEGVGAFELKGEKDVLISGLAMDSRVVKPNYLFAALEGYDQDGHDYISSSIDNGATVILCSRFPEQIKPGVTYIRSSDSRMVIGLIADKFYNHPSKKICCLGITGTNGKTTIATLLYNLFKELGYKVGLISTIEILVNEKKWNTSLTTPDVISLHRLIAEMVESDCTHVFMEVSSHAVDQKRIVGLDFDYAVFTNLTHDHLDYHGSFRAYIEAKQAFFSSLEDSAHALINADDKHGEVMVEHCKAKILWYSARRLADYKLRLLDDSSLGMELSINGLDFITRLAGDYNAMNLTAVYGVADLVLDEDEATILEKLSAIKGAKGRMEVVHLEPRVIVDYAHTPDAVINLLRSVKGSMSRGRLITVIGCGGDRDKAKRPKMALESHRQSDFLILTSDNPRNEDPQAIIDDMKMGLVGRETKNVLDMIDRKTAIKTAIALAHAEDTIVIAGKGHEEYQEINGQKHFFSDQQIVKDILSNDI